MLKHVRMKFLSCLALALGVVALSAGAAFADGTTPGTGTTGSAGASGTHTFNCDAAKTRLANVDNRIAKIQARIAGGQVKDPTAAATRLANAQNRATRITNRIAKRC